MKKKLKFSVLKSLLTSILWLYITITPVNATTNTDIDWNNILTNGKVSNYWIDSQCEYTVSIPLAARKLMYPSGMSNGITMYETNDWKLSKFDIYQSNSTGGARATTYTYSLAGAYVNKDRQDWGYVEIYINDYYLSNDTNDMRSATILHEMLHGLGLKDVNNTKSIMHYSNVSARPRTLTRDVNAVLNRKYP